MNSTMQGFAEGAIPGWIRCLSCGVNVLLSEAITGCPHCAPERTRVDGDPLEHTKADDDDDDNDDVQEGAQSLRAFLMRETSPLDQIIPGLYIGDWRAAEDLQLLQAHGITCVVNCAASQLPCHFEASQRCLYFRVPVRDELDQAVGPYLRPASAWIGQRRLQGRRVLVHCMQGVSRSATVVAAHLMLHEHMSLHHALLLIKKHRPVIKPNAAFMAALLKLTEET